MFPTTLKRLLIVACCIGPIVAQTLPSDQALFQAVQPSAATDVERLIGLGVNVMAVN